MEAGANVNITLDGVYIDGSGETSDFCAFKIADDSTGNVTITLADGSENKLISNQRCAGLQKNGSGSNIGTLTIKGSEEGTGKLIATSGKYGAGIGGGGSYGEEGYDSSNITISGGTVIASGSKFGAGIGGGASWDCAGGNGEDITISGGTVTATSWNGAGIGGGCSWNSTGGSGENINISGGTVTAKCDGKYGAGIGGGMHGSCSDVTISGGVVMATGSSGAGIGGGYNGNCSGVTISGGTVTTSSNIGPGIGGYSILGKTITVSDIKITGGSVKAVPSEGNYPIGDGYKTAVTPTNGNGENVSLYKVDNAENYNVKVNGETYTPVNHKAADDNDTDLYLYLTESAKNVEVDVNGTWLKLPFVTPPEPVANLLYSGIPQALVSQGSTTVGTLKYSLEKNGAYSTEIPKGTDAGTYTVWYMVESGEGHIGTSPKCVEVVISDELLSITAADGSELVKGEDYTYENKVLKVCTEKEVIISNIISDSANDHQIVIASCVCANVTLSNVKIDVSAKSDTAAFLIEDGGTGTVCVTLADGTTNTLISGKYCAGLQKNDKNVALVIDGNGTLNATGGKGSAGIGGGKDGSGSNITINGGTVNATSGRNDMANFVFCGAGIGGGHKGNGDYITINGGNVTAKSDDSEGSGIGGGFMGSGSYITVNGGIVYAEGANGAGIGGGSGGSGSYIEIIGGTVTAYSYSNGAGIGGGSGGSGSNIKISGGTVKATAKNNGTGIGGGYSSSGTDITISGGVVTATSNDQGAGIGGGMDAEASNIVITGGSVNAYSKNANAIGGGLNKAPVTPTLADMTTPVYLLTINADGADVSINGVKYPTHSDNNVYAYLPGDTNHTVRVGTSVTVYTYNADTSTWVAWLTLTAPAAVDGLVYDGTEQTLVSAGSAETGCTMSYSLTKDGTYTTALPTGKDAGTYEVWYKMTLGGTVFAGPDCVEVEISRRPVNVTADDAEKIYTEADPTFVFTIDSNTQLINGDTLEGTLTRVKGENVGTYDITQGTLTNEKNPNYDISFTAGTFTIKKATPQVTAPTAVTGLVYNGTAQELITVGKTDYGTLLYSLDGISYSTSIPTGTAADSYTVFYKVDGGANAEDVEEDAVLATIGKATPNVTAPKAKSGLVYTGTAQELISAGSTDIGTLLYSLDGNTYSENIPTPTNAGNYTVYYKVQGNSNVNDVGAQSFTVSIGKAPVTITANSYTIKVGADFPALDYTVTGLANGESLGVSPVLACETDNTSTAGSYTITVKFNIAEDEKYIYTVQNGILTVRKKSSGGSSGGGGSRPSTPTESSNPSIGGSSKSWSDVAADLGKLTNGSETTITLNGNTTVPVDVIKAIDDRQLKVTFVVDSAKSWKTDGAEITTPAYADLSILTTSKLKTDTLRGISGLQFTMNNTNIPTDLMIAFKKEHEGKFANLYKVVDGKLVFVTCAMLGEDGKVILPDVTEKGDYVVMLCEFSDRLGDMDNDGILNAKDSLAVIKNFLEIEKGANPLVADMNSDGYVNSKDALIILKKFLGIE